MIDLEVRYERPVDCPEATRPCWNAHDVRSVAYRSVFAGAAGHGYGHGSLWDFFDPSRPGGGGDNSFRGPTPWREALAAPGGDDMRHLKALMLSRPYFERIPDQSVIVTPLGHGDRLVAATRGRKGSYIFVYGPCLIGIDNQSSLWGAFMHGCHGFNGFIDRKPLAFATRQIEVIKRPRGNANALVLQLRFPAACSGGVSGAFSAAETC